MKNYIQYLPTSWKKLVKGLELEPSQFKMFKENFSRNTDLEMKEKRFYTYDYFSSFAKFKRTQLLPQSALFNTLKKRRRKLPTCTEYMEDI